MKNFRFARTVVLLVMMLTITLSITGGTIAWFSDSVESSANVIQAGNLDVDVLYDGTSSIQDATSLFNDVTYWEPGAVAWENLTVVNKGNLALKYEMTINTINENSVETNGVKYGLSSALKVALVNGGVQTTDRNALLNSIPASNWMSFADFMAKGSLRSENDTQTYGVVIYWQPTVADNNWNVNNGKQVSDYNDTGKNYLHIDLGVKLMATQLVAESDSFDNKYDTDASWDDSLWSGTTPSQKPDSITIDKDNFLISINDAEGLAYLNTLVNDADFATNYGSKWKYSIELNADINLLNKPWTPISLSNFVSFDGNGHTIKNLNVSGSNNNAGLFANVSSNDRGYIYVRNLTIDGANVSGSKSVGVVAGSSPQGLMENVTVKNATVTGTKYVGGLFGHGNGSANNCTVLNSTITILADDGKEAGGLIGYVSNDGKESAEDKVISGNHVENVTIKAPTIASGLVAQPNTSNTGSGKIVIKNNTMKNVTVVTEDSTAALYVSNNVGGKSVVENNTEENCKILTGAKTVEVDSQDELNNALSSGDVLSVELGSGSYTMPEPDLRGKTLTITGDKNAVLDMSAVDARDQFVTGANIVFDGVTLNFGKVNYMGLANTNSLTYKNCTINGLQFLFGNNVKFENCTLNSNGAEHCVWTYGAKNVSFADCEFIYGDRGINCYSDNDVPGGKQTVNFTNCSFTTENTASEGAVEINSSFFSVGIEANLKDCTAPAYGKLAYVSPWDSSNGAKTTINIQ